MKREPYKLLLHGIDTVQCAYFLVAPPGQGIPFAHLGMEKEMLRYSKSWWRKDRATSDEAPRSLGRV